MPPIVLDHRRQERSAPGGLSNRLGGGRDGGRQRGQVFAVEVTAGSGVDQEAVTPQDYHGLDPFALREGPHEVVNGGQWQLRRCSLRSLIGDRMKSSEQSLEVSQVSRLLFAVNHSSLSGLFARSASRRLALILGATAALGTAACDDPFAPRATATVRTDSFVVYSISQTPVNAPAAFNVIFFTTLRLEPSYGFDVAFDIDENGNVVLIPVRLVGGPLTANRRVGLQKITVPYDQMTRAPTTGYQYDSTLTLAAGEAALIEIQTEICQFQASQLVYA